MELLGAWLPLQRWFPVKTAEFTFQPAGSLRVDTGTGEGVPGAGIPGAAAFEVLLLAVSYPTPGGNRTDVVQVPLSFRPEPLPGAERSLIGELPGTRADAAHQWVYDGVHDASFVAAWLELMRHGGDSSSGSAAGHLVDSGYRLPFATGKVKVLAGEQSNSSVIVDDNDGGSAIVKFFRVLSEGQNPEVEIGAALTAGRTEEVPATLGWVTGEWETPAAAPGRSRHRPRVPRGASSPLRTNSSPADLMPGGSPWTRPAGGPGSLPKRTRWARRRPRCTGGSPKLWGPPPNPPRARTLRPE